jgi:uncharacterized protein (DUF305 family)
MTIPRFLISFVIALALLSPMTVGVSSAQDSTPYQKEIMDAHKKMMDGMMSMKPSGNVDMDFAMTMIPHHQGAVDMAEIELKYGKDPTLKKMARQIIAAQKKEIKEFEKWQSKHH